MVRIHLCTSAETEIVTDLQCQFKTIRYVAKRLCIGLLSRKTQVRLLSYRFSSTIHEKLVSAVRNHICPRRLMDKPGGFEPSDVRSIRTRDTVAVADLEMQRIVVPPYAGSSPVSHHFP